jgi:MarR family transcriptional regulator for hemolysin
LESSVDECGREMLDVIPLVMRGIRRELRLHRKDLSVPQFRTLFFLGRNQGPSLSDVAEHIGLTLPSMSSLVDELVERGLVKRETRSDDRRRMTLTLTARGEATLKSARESTLGYLGRLLRSLPTSDRSTVTRAMQVLKPVFAEGT